MAYRICPDCKHAYDLNSDWDHVCPTPPPLPDCPPSQHGEPSVVRDEDGRVEGWVLTCGTCESTFDVTP